MIEYDNFQKSLWRLEEQCENYRERDDSLPELTGEAITESVIRRFKTCYDCLWKVLKRYLIEELGFADVPNSPKPVFKLASENELLAAPLEEWLRYADARVDTAHDYSPFRNHSPLEGESARQGRSPQPSRWGDKQQACLDSMDNFIDDAIGLYQTMSGETWD